MEGLLSREAPLHGRASYRPTIGPLDYRDARELAPAGISPESAIERYAVIGGTPQYQTVGGSRSLGAGGARCAAEQGRAAVRRAADAGEGRAGHPRPQALFWCRLRRSPRGAPATRRSPACWNCPARMWPPCSGAARRASPTLRSACPSHPTTRRGRGYWQVSDPFFRFWFRRVAPNRSRLDRGEGLDAVWDQVPRPRHLCWQGL